MTSPVTITQPYARLLADARHLEPGQWSDETASGLPAIACRSCGAIQEIAVGDTHRIVEGDRVVPPYECVTVTCRLVEYVLLRDYSGEVLR